MPIFVSLNSGGSSGIVALSPVLGSAVNSTEEIDILNVPIPANSWADGEEICLERLFTRATNSGGTCVLRIYVGATKVLELGPGGPLSYPDYGYNVYGMLARRIGSDLWVFCTNANTGTPTLESFDSGTIGNTDATFYDGSGNSSYGNWILLASDFSAAQNLRITIQWNVASPLCEVSALSANVWKYPADGAVSNGTLVPLVELAGLIDGLNDTFTFPSAPFSSTPVIYFNGLEQDPSLYSLVGSTVVFSTPPVPSGSGGDHIFATYWTAGQPPYLYPNAPLAGTIDGINTDFTFPSSLSPVAGSEVVWYNGLEQNPADYSVAGNTLSFVSPPVPSGSGTDLLGASFWRNAQDAKYIAHETPAATANPLVFTLANPVDSGKLVLTINGLAQFPGLHYALSGATITLDTNPGVGAVLDATYWKL